MKASPAPVGADTYWWELLDESGTTVAGDDLPASAQNLERFHAQADAETWLGEVWRELADEGVSAVNLRRGGQLVYGPMSLSEDIDA